ncbi:MAG: formylglycine-generating enzyme family protein [Saprospiraceae bacterium]|jgi:sulfatase modifying factor 1|nr:formylglycine-generating enzyme family protein [Saprospiraceae bacterium]
MRLLFLVFFPFSLLAQPCDYARLMREGKAKVAGSNPAYSQALNKFNAARTCAPSKSIEVDREVARVFKMIEGERDRALLAEKNATAALRKLQAALADVVRFVLRDADERILRLDYEDAYAKLNNVQYLDGPLMDSVAYRLLEIAYFRHQSGDTVGAREPFDRAAALLGKPELHSSAAGFDSEFARLHKPLLGLLKKRYYPTILPLPSGTYWMGRDTTLEKGAVEETPRHQVYIDSFGLAQTEITFWQWSLFVASKKRNIHQNTPTWGMYGDCPVVYVDWFDVCEYANWLSERENRTPVYLIDSVGQPKENWRVSWLPEGNGYRLPTEAEWEYAARGGANDTYFIFAGSNDIGAIGWYKGNSGIRNVLRTHPVGEKIPVEFSNKSSVYDLTGNVWEWCWDVYDPKIYETFSGAVASNPRGPGEWLKENVIRGGGWGREEEHARVSLRTKYRRHGKGPDIGFRIARQAP